MAANEQDQHTPGCEFDQAHGYECTCGNVANTSLPPVQISGQGWLPSMRDDDSRGPYYRAMTLADLCALVAAIDDRQLIVVLEAAGVFESNKRVADAWSRELKAKHAAEDAFERLKRDIGYLDLSGTDNLLRDVRCLMQAWQIEPICKPFNPQCPEPDQNECARCGGGGHDGSDEVTDDPCPECNGTGVYVPCVRCAKPVECERRIYAIPHCYECLPPPTPLDVAHSPSWKECFEKACDAGAREAEIVHSLRRERDQARERILELEERCAGLAERCGLRP